MSDQNLQLFETVQDIALDFQFALKQIDTQHPRFSSLVSDWAWQFIQNLTMVCMPETKLEFELVESKSPKTIKFLAPKVLEESKEQTKSLEKVAQKVKIETTKCLNLACKAPPVLH